MSCGAWWLFPLIICLNFFFLKKQLKSMWFYIEHWTCFYLILGIKVFFYINIIFSFPEKISIHSFKDTEWFGKNGIPKEILIFALEINFCFFCFLNFCLVCNFAQLLLATLSKRLKSLGRSVEKEVILLQKLFECLN